MAKLKDILPIVDGILITQGADLEIEIHYAAGSDLMSDVLAFVKPEALLLTGLVNPQVVRTAEMADIAAIIFVRGKTPSQEVIALAEEKRIPLISSQLTMFEICGRLYEVGLRSCDVAIRS